MKANTCWQNALLAAAVYAALTTTASAQAQPKSGPPFPIRGCVTFLKMSDAQAKSINSDLDRVAVMREQVAATVAKERELKLRRDLERERSLDEERKQLMEERTRLIEQRMTGGGSYQSPPSAPAYETPSSQTSGDRPVTPAVTVAPMETINYDEEIGKIETGLQTKRQLLADIDRVYRNCIAKPPQTAAVSVPAAKKAKAPVRRTVAAPREQNLRAATPPRSGGHDPAASAIVSGAIGGAIGGFAR